MDHLLAQPSDKEDARNDALVNQILGLLAGATSLEDECSVMTFRDVQRLVRSWSHFDGGLTLFANKCCALFTSLPTEVLFYIFGYLSQLQLRAIRAVALVFARPQPGFVVRPIFPI
jgi:hypothetical protein